MNVDRNYPSTRDISTVAYCMVNDVDESSRLIKFISQIGRNDLMYEVGVSNVMYHVDVLSR